MLAPLNKDLFPNYTDLKAQSAQDGAVCIYPSRACVDVGEDHGYMVFNHGLHLAEIKGTSTPSKKDKDAQFNLGVSISLNYTFRCGCYFNKVVCQKEVPFEEIYNCSLKCITLMKDAYTSVCGRITQGTCSNCTFWCLTPGGPRDSVGLWLGPGICIVTTVQKILSDPDIQEAKL